MFFIGRLKMHSARAQMSQRRCPNLLPAQSQPQLELMNSVTSELCFVNGSPPSQVWTNSKTFLNASIYLICAVGLFVWCCVFTEPMEEDILQVVKYCTELVEDKDLEKLYLVIKYMKRYCSEFSLAKSYNKHKCIINLTSSIA